YVNFSPTEVCLDYITTFTDQSTVSNAHTNNSKVAWDWDFADGSSSNLQNPQHKYTNPGVYPAVLTVTTNHNCKNDSSIDVIVYPLPDVSLIGNNLTGCAPIC